MDSFYKSIHPFLQANIEQISFTGTDFDYALISSFKPDVVIYELVERRVHDSLLGIIKNE